MSAPQVPNWQTQILQSVGAPVTPQNVNFFNAWAQAEGGSASNNPFNTTQGAPGAGSYNSVGVKNYLSPSQGVNATIATLKNGRYENILQALRQGTSSVLDAQALAQSPWGTGNLVLKVLGAGGVNPSPTAPGSSAAQSTSPSSVLDLLNAGNRIIGLPELSGLPGFPSAPQRQPIQGPLPSPSRGAAPPSVKGKRAVNLAAHMLGIPYVWGGESLKGFDCSGLLQYVWKQQGVNIPRTTYDQFKQGVPVPTNQLQAGDAVFFKGSDSKNGLPGHVGIYIGGGKFIEAPKTGLNVRISTLAGRTDYQGARRYA